MSLLAALLVVFVWLKAGGAIDLSWWWLLLPLVVCILDGFVDQLVEEIAAYRRSRRSWRSR